MKQRRQDLSAGAGCGGHERGGAPDRGPRRCSSTIGPRHHRNVIARLAIGLDPAHGCPRRRLGATPGRLNSRGASRSSRQLTVSGGLSRRARIRCGFDRFWRSVLTCGRRLGRMYSRCENPSQAGRERVRQGENPSQPGETQPCLVRKSPARPVPGSGRRRRDRPPRRSAEVPSRRRSSGRRARRGPGTSG